MQTIDLRNGARGKVGKLTEALRSEHFIHGSAPMGGLAAYHAAHDAIIAQACVEPRKRFARTQEALRAFRAMVSLTVDNEGRPFVRVFIPTKQTEIMLGA